MIFQASSNKSASARMTTSSEFVCVHVQFFVLLSEELTLGDSTNRVYGILMWDQGERIMGGGRSSIGASNLAQESTPLQYWAYERKFNFCKVDHTSETRHSQYNPEEQPAVVFTVLTTFSTCFCLSSGCTIWPPFKMTSTNNQPITSRLSLLSTNNK